MGEDDSDCPVDSFHEVRVGLGCRVHRQQRGVRSVLCEQRVDDSVLAGAIPNWILNRRWAWQRQGRPPARQIIGYIGVSIVVLVTTSAATGWTNAHVQSIPAHHGFRLLIVIGAYVAVTIVLFIAKFGIYEYWVFSEHSRVRAAFRFLRRSPRTARANRMAVEARATKE